MYDPITKNFISSIPNLETINRDELPKILSSFYSDIVAYDGILLTAEGRYEQLREAIQRLRKIANVLEAFLLLTDRSEIEKRACAFVSATARRFLAKFELDANEVRPLTDKTPSSIIAGLLFLISGNSADAIEAVKDFRLESYSLNDQLLILNLINLIHGRPSNYMPMAFTDQQLWENPASKINDRINKVTSEISRFCLGDTNLTSQEIIQSLDVVKNQCVQESNMTNELGTFTFDSIFGPQLHLVKILRQTFDLLPRRSLALLEAPGNIERTVWKDTLSTLVRLRPYLWDNHLQAINTLYLTPGTSAVVSLPTGSGKTTIANLKIASSLCLHGKVIYLVPTHALSAQVKQSLAEEFSSYQVSESLIGDGSYSETDDPALADITVMTPERLLSLLGLYPHIFFNVTLLVFDECHLLHSDYGDRRSLDAMLALIKTMNVSPDLDLLLMSAMIRNVEELSLWLTNSWGKNCVPILIDWKPTRQLRGALIFNHDQIYQAQSNVNHARQRLNAPRPNAEIKRLARATPYGIFCLNREWNRNIQDYRFLQMLDTDIQLGLSNNFRITPNKNLVAEKIATKLVSNNKKVLIFAQNRKHCESIAQKISNNVNTTANLNHYEQGLWNALIDEVGHEQKILGLYHNSAGCHHSLMLPQERLLVESLFKRNEGIKVLVATPTLAQGLNLPAEVVILTGDERFEDGGSEKLKAYELLNAAGRAGRAGFVANGLVLIIPSRVLEYNVTRQRFSGGWNELQLLFSSGDQVLDVEDPFKTLLESASLAENSDKLNYLLSMLPRGYSNNESELKKILRKTFGFYKATRAGNAALYENSMNVAEQVQNSITESQNEWLRDLCRNTGIRREVLESIFNFISLRQTEFVEGSTRELINLLFEWMINNLEFADQFFRDETKEKMGDDPTERFLLMKLLIDSWLDISPLDQLKDLFNQDSVNVKWDKARFFVLKVTPEISYLAGIFLYCIRHGLGIDTNTRIYLSSFPTCIREGFLNVVHLAGRYILGKNESRRSIANYLSQVEVTIDTENETFTTLIGKINQALIPF